MFLTFFPELRAAKVPVTLREYLTLIEAIDEDLAGSTSRTSTTSPAPAS